MHNPSQRPSPSLPSSTGGLRSFQGHTNQDVGGGCYQSEELFTVKKKSTNFRKDKIIKKPTEVHRNRRRYERGGKQRGCGWEVVGKGSGVWGNGGETEERRRRGGGETEDRSRRDGEEAEERRRRAGGETEKRRRRGGGEMKERRRRDREEAEERRRKGGGKAEERRRRGGEETEKRRSGGRGQAEERRRRGEGEAEERQRRGG